MGRYGYSNSADRFPNYIDMDARFDSVGSCGHSIARGDPIGYHGGLRKALCAACWAKWANENAEADQQEDADAMLMGGQY